MPYAPFDVSSGTAYPGSARPRGSAPDRFDHRTDYRAHPAGLKLVPPPDPGPVVTQRRKGPRWVTVLLVTAVYGAAYVLAWIVVRALA